MFIVRKDNVEKLSMINREGRTIYLNGIDEVPGLRMTRD
jgi:hypothetical protein